MSSGPILRWRHLKDRRNLICRLFWTRVCLSLWSSPRTSLAISMYVWNTRIIFGKLSRFTWTGQAHSGTRGYTLWRGKRSQFRMMRFSSFLWLAHHLFPQDTNMCDHIAFGDIYPNALDHFCSLVDDVALTMMSFSHFSLRCLFPSSRMKTTSSGFLHVSPMTLRNRWKLLLIISSTITGARAGHHCLPDQRPHQGQDSAASPSGSWSVNFLTIFTLSSGGLRNRGGGETGQGKRRQRGWQPHQEQHWGYHPQVGVSGTCSPLNHLSSTSSATSTIFSSTDGRGAGEGLCRGSPEGAQPWANDWDQVLGGQGLDWDMVDGFYNWYFSVQTWSRCLSRWRQTPQRRWPPSSMSRTVPTIPASGGPGWRSCLTLVQVNVPECCECSERVPRHHDAPETADRQLLGDDKRALRRHFPHDAQALEAMDFADVRPLFAPLMHTVRFTAVKLTSSFEQ